jgi:hypothetical protein
MRCASLVFFVACSNAAAPVIDAPFVPIDAPADAPHVEVPALKILVVNEVAAGDTPDWFEVVNASASPVQLDHYVYVDTAGDLAKARPFPAMTLPPGAYFAQAVDDTSAGFKLGSDEAIWVYRAADRALSDGVDWDEGASPAGASYARSPDRTGAFVTGSPSQGAPNP